MCTNRKPISPVPQSKKGNPWLVRRLRLQRGHGKPRCTRLSKWTPLPCPRQPCPRPPCGNREHTLHRRAAGCRTCRLLPLQRHRLVNQFLARPLSRALPLARSLFRARARSLSCHWVTRPNPREERCEKDKGRVHRTQVRAHKSFSAVISDSLHLSIHPNPHFHFPSHTRTYIRPTCSHPPWISAAEFEGEALEAWHCRVWRWACIIISRLGRW